MEIRVLNENDAAAYWRLRLESLQDEPFAFGKAADEHAATTVDATAARFRTMSAGDFNLGAFDGERLIGIATFLREPGRKARHKGRIYGVYVVPSKRGTGAGRALMESVLARAKEDPSLEQILISVTSTQEAAQRLYRKLGFEEYGTEPRAVKIGPDYVDEIHMIRRLTLHL